MSPERYYESTLRGQEEYQIVGAPYLRSKTGYTKQQVLVKNGETNRRGTKTTRRKSHDI